MEDCQPARKMSRFGGCFAEGVSNRSGVAGRERGRHEGLSSAAGNSVSIRLASGWIASSSVEARGSPRWPIGSAPSAEEPPRRTFRWRSRSRTGRSSRVSWTTGSRSTRSTRSSSTGSATTSRPSAPRTTASTPASSTRDAVGSVVEPWVLDLWAKVPTPSKARRVHRRTPREPAIAVAPGTTEAPQALARRDYKALRCMCGVASVTRRSGKYKLVVRRMAAHGVFVTQSTTGQRSRSSSTSSARPSTSPFAPAPCVPSRTACPPSPAPCSEPRPATGLHARRRIMRADLLSQRGPTARVCISVCATACRGGDDLQGGLPTFRPCF